MDNDIFDPIIIFFNSDLSKNNSYNSIFVDLVDSLFTYPIKLLLVIIISSFNLLDVTSFTVKFSKILLFV